MSFALFLPSRRHIDQGRVRQAHPIVHKGRTFRRPPES
ncbi:hypothetical protein SAMN05216188_12453 [Lentzea xinjiangensis]|uniref:Uncharacterized protein n=1 Tax=Lentzea xinjiangensis TaxID=402600 RepID=A0A1H9V5P8_9PSEU|nr:hypothetical protein SAMN05216188_12453 [Lentzea xinjiangensis]